MLSRVSSLAATAGSRASSTSTASASALHARKSFPRIAWLNESWLATMNQYERIATGSPRIGVGIMGYHLIEQHINLLPTLGSPADFVPVHGAASAGVIGGYPGHAEVPGATMAPDFVGVRPKLPTWPLTKQEAMRTKVWQV